PVSCSLCGNLLIVRFVRRWRFFPLMGQADGLRQPVHAADVTTACVSALTMPAAANRTYNLSDGETLSYRELVFDHADAARDLGFSPRPFRFSPKDLPT